MNTNSNIVAGYRSELLTARRHLNIPTEHDFFSEPRGDAEYAWEVFGGLSLDVAFDRYLELPDSYQEAFMWMVPRAFEYYFPVVDRYLRGVDVRIEDHPWDDGCEAWILGCAIELQFHGKDGSCLPDYMIGEISELSAYVRSSLDRYSEDPDERLRIDRKWQKLESTLSQFANKHTE